MAPPAQPAQPNQRSLSARLTSAAAVGLTAWSFLVWCIWQAFIDPF